MKKITAFTISAIELPTILHPNQKFLIRPNQTELHKIGLTSENIFQSGGLTVFNITLHEKNLPNKVLQDELQRRLKLETRCVSEAEIQAASERITLEIIEQALNKTSFHKVYLNKGFMLVEASGKQCDIIWRFMKDLLSDFVDFKEFTTELVTMSQDLFNAKYQQVEALRVSCKIDDDNSLSFVGAELIDQKADMVGGVIKQFTTRTDDLEYTVNNKLVFSGIKFFNDVESEQEALDIEHASYLFPLISEYKTWTLETNENH